MILVSISVEFRVPDNYIHVTKPTIRLRVDSDPFQMNEENTHLHFLWHLENLGDPIQTSRGTWKT